MISFRAEHAVFSGIQADVVVVFIREDAAAFKQETSSLKRTFPSLARGLASGAFTGKFQQTLTLFPAERKTTLLLVGLGEGGKLTIERVRRCAATAAKTANTLKAISAAIITPGTDHNPDAVAQALVEGAGLSLYKYDKYLTTKDSPRTTLRRIRIVTFAGRSIRQVRRGVARGTVIVEATCLARDLANAPPNEIYPDTLARNAVRAARHSGLSVSVWDEKKITRLKMGGVLAVARGSERPPRFIMMEYNKRRRRLPTVVLVGKGVTFDAGGISIKPAAGMSEMKMDMSGAATVIAVMQAAAKLKPAVHLVGLIPAVENLLGGSAMKPGDIITHLSGKTSEVDNTDAEGRLILADALTYASRYKPDLVIDLATLTGAVVVALGTHATGMMGNDQPAMDQLMEAGERTYERVWQLPMFEEYAKLNKSDVADVKNSGGRAAGSITAAFFLKQFIGEYKWVHLDIAGTAIMHEALDYIPKGASGVGVRLLVDFLDHWRAK